MFVKEATGKKNIGLTEQNGGVGSSCALFFLHALSSVTHGDKSREQMVFLILRGITSATEIE